MGELEPVYSLKEAVAKVLKGRWTVASLRTEIRKGRLRPTRIAGKLGVTDSALGDMLKLCQDEPRARAFTLDRPDSNAVPSGSLSTEEKKLALDAAKQTAKALRTRSLSISHENTNRRKPTDVLAKLPSQT